MQYAPDTTNDSPPELKLAALRAAAEVELLGAVLAKPADLIAIAENEGIAQWDFGQDDLRLIWLAAKVAGEAGGGAATVCLLARRALQAEGLWDDTQIGGNWRASMLWSDASLARLMCSHFPNPSQVQVGARKLLGFIRAQELAEKLAKRSERIILAAISPPIRIRSRSTLRRPA